MSSLNFKVLMASRKHNYIGSMTFTSRAPARSLRNRINDKLNTEITMVAASFLQDNIQYAYFIGDVTEDLIDRARTIIKERKGN